LKEFLKKFIERPDQIFSYIWCFNCFSDTVLFQFD
jgi:hypothetical protein